MKGEDFLNYPKVSNSLSLFCCTPKNNRVNTREQPISNLPNFKFTHYHYLPLIIKCHVMQYTDTQIEQCVRLNVCLQVLWRYSGEKPETLGANTRLYNWIPQNDLLGK